VDARGRDLSIRVIDLPRCFVPGYEAHVAEDDLAIPSRAVYASADGTDLFAYLRARKVKKPVCATCTHAAFCTGFYDASDAPEPPWLARLSAPSPLPTISRASAG